LAGKRGAEVGTGLTEGNEGNKEVPIREFRELTLITGYAGDFAA
jgi:hypothetical protein